MLTALPLWYLATAQPNRAKTYWQRKGGGGRGTPKLTEDMVRAIRADNRRTAVIAKEYGLTYNYTDKVKRGETHVRWP